MTEQGEEAQWKSSTRGESAWKEARALVASRNEEAQKSGRLRQQAYERDRESARQAAEARRHAKLMSRRRTP